MIELVASKDTDFEWMLGDGPSRHGLTLPPGGVDDENILRIVRRMNLALLQKHDRGAWMIVQIKEVVGLCGYIRPPIDGEVEIGFGVASSRRNKGYASAAVGAMLTEAREDPMVDIVVARTAVKNLPSQHVLERNQFMRTGTDIDDDDGKIILWHCAI